MTYTESARFVYIFGSSNAKPQGTLIVFLTQPVAEHQSLVGVFLVL